MDNTAVFYNFKKISVSDIESWYYYDCSRYFMWKHILNLDENIWLYKKISDYDIPCDTQNDTYNNTQYNTMIQHNTFIGDIEDKPNLLNINDTNVAWERCGLSTTIELEIHFFINCYNQKFNSEKRIRANNIVLRTGAILNLENMTLINTTGVTFILTRKHIYTNVQSSITPYKHTLTTTTTTTNSENCTNKHDNTYGDIDTDIDIDIDNIVIRHKRLIIGNSWEKKIFEFLNNLKNNIVIDCTLLFKINVHTNNMDISCDNSTPYFYSSSLNLDTPQQQDIVHGEQQKQHLVLSTSSASNNTHIRQNIDEWKFFLKDIATTPNITINEIILLLYFYIWCIDIEHSSIENVKTQQSTLVSSSSSSPSNFAKKPFSSSDWKTNFAETYINKYNLKPLNSSEIQIFRNTTIHFYQFKINTNNTSIYDLLSSNDLTNDLSTPESTILRHVCLSNGIPDILTFSFNDKTKKIKLNIIDVKAAHEIKEMHRLQIGLYEILLQMNIKQYLNVNSHIEDFIKNILLYNIEWCTSIWTRPNLTFTQCSKSAEFTKTWLKTNFTNINNILSENIVRINDDDIQKYSINCPTCPMFEHCNKYLPSIKTSVSLFVDARQNFLTPAQNTTLMQCNSAFTNQQQQQQLYQSYVYFQSPLRFINRNIYSFDYVNLNCTHVTFFIHCVNDNSCNIPGQYFAICDKNTGGQNYYDLFSWNEILKHSQNVLMKHLKTTRKKQKSCINNLKSINLINENNNLIFGASIFSHTELVKLPAETLKKFNFLTTNLFLQQIYLIYLILSNYYPNIMFNYSMFCYKEKNVLQRLVQAWWSNYDIFIDEFFANKNYQNEKWKFNLKAFIINQLKLELKIDNSISLKAISSSSSSRGSKTKISKNSKQDTLEVSKTELYIGLLPKSNNGITVLKNLVDEMWFTGATIYDSFLAYYEILNDVFNTCCLSAPNNNLMQHCILDSKLVENYRLKSSLISKDHKYYANVFEETIKYWLNFQTCVEPLHNHDVVLNDNMNMFSCFVSLFEKKKCNDETYTNANINSKNINLYYKTNKQLSNHVIQYLEMGIYFVYMYQKFTNTYCDYLMKQQQQQQQKTIISSSFANILENHNLYDYSLFYDLIFKTTEENKHNFFFSNNDFCRVGSILNYKDILKSNDVFILDHYITLGKKNILPINNNDLYCVLYNLHFIHSEKKSNILSDLLYAIQFIVLQKKYLYYIEKQNKSCVSLESSINTLFLDDEQPTIIEKNDTCENKSTLFHDGNNVNDINDINDVNINTTNRISMTSFSHTLNPTNLSPTSSSSATLNNIIFINYILKINTHDTTTITTTKNQNLTIYTHKGVVEYEQNLKLERPNTMLSQMEYLFTENDIDEIEHQQKQSSNSCILIIPNYDCYKRILRTINTQYMNLSEILKYSVICSLTELKISNNKKHILISNNIAKTIIKILRDLLITKRKINIQQSNNSFVNINDENEVIFDTNSMIFILNFKPFNFANINTIHLSLYSKQLYTVLHNSILDYFKRLKSNYGKLYIQNLYLHFCLTLYSIFDTLHEKILKIPSQSILNFETYQLSSLEPQILANSSSSSASIHESYDKFSLQFYNSQYYDIFYHIKELLPWDIVKPDFLASNPILIFRNKFEVIFQQQQMLDENNNINSSSSIDFSSSQSNFYQTIHNIHLKWNIHFNTNWSKQNILNIWINCLNSLLKTVITQYLPTSILLDKNNSMLLKKDFDMCADGYGLLNLFSIDLSKRLESPAKNWKNIEIQLLLFKSNNSVIDINVQNIETILKSSDFYKKHLNHHLNHHIADNIKFIQPQQHQNNNLSRFYHILYTTNNQNNISASSTQSPSIISTSKPSHITMKNIVLFWYNLYINMILNEIYKNIPNIRLKILVVVESSFYKTITYFMEIWKNINMNNINNNENTNDNMDADNNNLSTTNNNVELNVVQLSYSQSFTVASNNIQNSNINLYDVSNWNDVYTLYSKYQNAKNFTLCCSKFTFEILEQQRDLHFDMIFYINDIDITNNTQISTATTTQNNNFLELNITRFLSKRTLFFKHSFN